MSFILDALRKSDKKRPAGAVPDLQTEHLGPPPAPRRKMPLALILVALALLINAGLLLWWLKPWQPPASEQTALPASETPPSAPPAVASVPEPLAPLTAAPAAPTPSAPAPVAVAPPAPPAPPTVAPPPPMPVAPQASMFAPAEEPAPAAVPDAWLAALAQPQEADLARTLPGLPLLKDLPGEVRAALPEFSFSLHYFTTSPAERLVRINGRLLREGQSLAEGLVLEEITEGGAVFDYRGRLFEVLR
ncbi:general secretion pathway protein GspB [Geoalkalibacter sp.]|uniref:general secretion pathway protein GspB n=1 Tax=Geoalkalibacter sp. TaxID=3041440 RepID=UPI00272DE391|nr:general secretion pathway protein GspB [Geoalkalibacter sp.]